MHFILFPPQGPVRGEWGEVNIFIIKCRVSVRTLRCTGLRYMCAAARARATLSTGLHASVQLVGPDYSGPNR